MTLTFSGDNSYAPTTKEDSSANVPATPMKKALSTVAKRFWEYTKANSEADTKSFEGWL